MEHHKVNSSDIASIGYEPDTQTLAVEFHATGMYQYFSVPQDIYDGFRETPTHGKYFYQNIKGKYAWEKATG